VPASISRLRLEHGEGAHRIIKTTMQHMHEWHSKFLSYPYQISKILLQMELTSAIAKTKCQLLEIDWKHNNALKRSDYGYEYID